MVENCRVNDCQKRLLVAALRRLEDANDKLASLRTQEQYLVMLDAGQEFALADLQDARNEAKQLLAVVSPAKDSGGKTPGDFGA